MTADPGQSGPGPVIARRLGVKLRDLREQRSLRLEDIAARLRVARRTLSRIETGKGITCNWARLFADAGSAPI